MNRREKLFISGILIIFFSVMYHLCERLSEGKSIYENNSYLDSLHFSIITQCTIGYGHMYAISPIAIMLVNIQCLSTLYIVYS